MEQPIYNVILTCTYRRGNGFNICESHLIHVMNQSTCINGDSYLEYTFECSECKSLNICEGHYCPYMNGETCAHVPSYLDNT